MSATNSAPSRNMTSVIRAVRPVSLMNRECAMSEVKQATNGGSAGIRPSSLEQLAHLVDAWRRRAAGSGRTRRGPRRRAGLPRCGRRRAARPGPAANAASSPASTARLDRGVELVEPVRALVGDVVLPLAEDPHDHAWPSLRRRCSLRLGLGLEDGAAVVGAASIACGAAVPALRRGQLGLDVGLRAHRVELAGDVVAAVRASSRRRARRRRSARRSRRPGPASARSCPRRAGSAMPTSPISSPMPDIASLMRVCASAAV